MKKALVLGGTYPHISLLQKLRAMGYHTTLIDYLDYSPALKFADCHIKESTLDKDKVLEIARDNNVNLVISSCIDQANVTCCYVGEKLNLPHPYSYEVAVNATDKGRMKRIMMDNSIPTARYYEIESIMEFDDSKLCYPIIVKPADANSSKGVRRIDENDPNAREYISQALEISRNGKVIVEEFMEGREIGADCMIIDGEPHIIMTRERLKIQKNNPDAIQQIYGAFWPANLTMKQLEALKEIAGKIAKAFHISNSPLIIQSILKEDKFKIIEFGARIGGGDNYQIIEELTGYDIIQNSINSFLGLSIKPYDLYEKRDRILLDNYLYVLPPACKGVQTFGGIDYSEEALKLIEYSKVYKKVGTEIGYRISSNNRVGCFVVSGDSQEEVLAKRNKVVENMDIIDTDNNSIMKKDIYV